MCFDAVSQLWSPAGFPIETAVIESKERKARFIDYLRENKELYDISDEDINEIDAKITGVLIHSPVTYLDQTPGLVIRVNMAEYKHLSAPMTPQSLEEYHPPFYQFFRGELQVSNIRRDSSDTSLLYDLNGVTYAFQGKPSEFFLTLARHYESQPRVERRVYTHWLIGTSDVIFY